MSNTKSNAIPAGTENTNVKEDKKMKKSSGKKMSRDDSMKTLKKVMTFIGRYKALLVLSIVLAALSVVLQLYIPILFGNAIDGIIAKGKVDFGIIGYYLIRILIMVLIAGIATFVMNLINNRLTYRVVQDIRSKAIRKIQVLPLSYLDTKETGDIVSCVIADVDQVSDGLLLGLTQLFSGVVTIIMTLVFMFMKSLPITLLVIVLTPLSFFVAKFIASHSYNMFHKMSDTRGELTALTEEMVNGQKIVKAFGYEDKASKRFSKINDDLRKYSEKGVFYSSLTNPSTRFINSIIYALVALVGAFMVPGGSLTVGGLSVMLSYANQYMKPFNDISSVVTELQNALACADRVFSLIEEEPEKDAVDVEEYDAAVADAKPTIANNAEATNTTAGKNSSSANNDIQLNAYSTNADNTQLNAGPSKAASSEIVTDHQDVSLENTSGSVKGEVEIKDVAFSYDKSKHLIEGFNLNVKPGMNVAIVGPTGCGKTTFINLLMRFYDVDNGTISIDGKNIYDMSRHELRQHYGMVLQETWLKNATVRENIAFGKPEATDEEIIAAAKAAHSYEFIRRMPKGLDTVITDDDLSQGQKQLLCITRVMLALPPMLILDEATSSIDTRTELMIQEAFNKMMEGRTSFIVAHRLSTIRNADVILVMKDGKIIEQGNHESLLAANGFYTKLYNSQWATND
jgi:ATP-binding cassette subfamily B protein